MSKTRMYFYRTRMIFSIILGATGFAAIALLYINITSDLQRLSSASSDNVQWTLSQTEVEFLEYENQLEKVMQDIEPDLSGLRRGFDIFYSRVHTLGHASIYASVREIPEFSENLAVLSRFIESAAETIDSRDPALVFGLKGLLERTVAVRPNVRQLSNSGLNFFAKESDTRRENISDTLSQMALGVTALTLALMLFAFYLAYLNRLNVRRRREAIQTSQRMNIVTSTSLDAVIVVDINGHILDFNSAAEQIFGYDADYAKKHDLAELIIPEQYRALHEAGMQRMRDSGDKRVVGTGRITLEAQRANGEIFPVEFAIQSAKTDDGEIFVSFLRDISSRVAEANELVKARDSALAGEKAKTDFLATMSHEIRTPLNGLLGNLTLINDTKLSAKQLRYIKNMETSGKLLMSHISDVLDITKYDAGKLQLRPTAVNLNSLLQDIVNSQSGAATANNTTLKWGWTGDSVNWIFADQDRIQHILMNVVGNAVKFTRDGKVWVEAQVIGDLKASPEIEITVHDTGIGMSPDLKAKIFDDFLTGDASYDRDVGGTGLGLGIALRFANALGGTIDVESEEGVGSSFAIRFPIEPTRAPVKPSQHHVKLSEKHNSHILLVEDNEINRVVAREMLTAAGHQVSEAHNGKIAVEMAQDQTFDLILMDISMPVMDGRAATRAIRSLDGPSATTPIVALTANAMAEEQEAFIKDGMNDILTKPLSRDRLLDALAHYTEAPMIETAKPVVVSASLVDQTHLQELKDTLGEDVLAQLVGRFTEEVDETVTYLTNSADRPLEEIAQRAHKIAGSAATLGTVDLRAALVAVEVAAKQDDSAGTQAAITGLPDIWAATRAALDA